jgi:hypothetical protein
MAVDGASRPNTGEDPPSATVEISTDPFGGSAIDRRPGSAPAAPFFTRNTILAFSAVAIASFLAFAPLYAASDHGSGALGLFAATAEGLTAVTGTVAWIGGCLLAIRRGSMLWVLVAVFVPLVGPVMVALFSPPTPPATR